MHFRDGEFRTIDLHHCVNKFHQFDQSLRLLFGSLVRVSTSFCGSRFMSLSGALVTSVTSGLILLREEYARFIEFSKAAEGCSSRASRSSKTYPEEPSEISALSGNPELRQYTLLVLGRAKKMTCNVGCSRAPRRFRVVKIPLLRQRQRIHFVL